MGKYEIINNIYNVVDSTYLNALKSRTVTHLTKIQALDHWENVLDEIYADILTDNPAQQTVGSGNGIRRSLTLTLYDGEEKYSPNKNSHFWYNRKIRLVEGTKVGNNIYWQYQGVYWSTAADEQNKLLTISAADKFAALNGELGTGRCVLPFSTDISGGTIYVADLIRETLAMNTGALPIDPITPIIDQAFEDTPLYADIALNAGQYYGEILTTLAAMYGADCYYDRSGRFNFRRKGVHDRPWWYMHEGYAWTFTEDDINIIEGVRRTTDLHAVNIVTVMSDNSEGEVACYTARNTNPESPVCVQNVGEQYPDEPIVYISIGDTTRQTAEEKCRQYAEYLLMQYTAQQCSEEFTTPEIPHLDVDKLISLHGEDRLITGITIDHKSRLMQLTTCSVNYLPSGRVEV